MVLSFKPVKRRWRFPFVFVTVVVLRKTFVLMNRVMKFLILLIIVMFMTIWRNIRQVDFVLEAVLFWSNGRCRGGDLEIRVGTQLLRLSSRLGPRVRGRRSAVH